MAKCAKCGAEIVWQLTTAEKHMPCDPTVVAVVTELGSTVRGRIQHWATCPNADDFRRSRKGDP